MSHGVWCKAFVRETHCRHCGREAWFFACGCGSRVLFEQLGQPWPKHVCAQGLIAKYGFTAVQVQALVAQRARELEEPPPSIDHLFEEEVVRNRERPPAIIKVAPGGPPRREFGVVREVAAGVDPRRKLGVMPHSLGERQLLRRLPIPTIQVTIHVGGLGAPRTESFTGWLSSAAAGLAPKVGDLVEAKLVAVQIPGIPAFWAVEALADLADREVPAESTG